MTKTQQRIIELVAELPLWERREVIDRIESSGLLDEPPPLPLELTDDERAQLEASREDFRAGRTMSLDEAERETDAFLEGLRRRT